MTLIHHPTMVFITTTLKSVMKYLKTKKECDKLRKDGFHNSHYYSQGPSLSTTNLSDCTTQDHKEDKKSAVPSAKENMEFPPRPQTPLEGGSDWPGSDDDVQMGWSRTLPLPTPEERMRQHALTIAAHIIPINVTGETFDRQASARRSIVTTDTMVRWPKKIRRTQTITGVPHDIQEEPAVKQQSEFRDHSMYVPSLCSMTSALCSSQTRDSSCQMEDERMDKEEDERMAETEDEGTGEVLEGRTVPPSLRRIQAQQGQGMIANISTSSSCNVSTIDCTTDQRFHSMPSQGPYSLQTNPCYTISPYWLEDLPAGTLLCQMSQLHGVMIGAQESEREQAGNGWGAPHALPSAPPIPNTLLAKARSSELYATHTQSTPSDRTLAMVGVTLNIPPHYHNSASFLSDSPSETDSQCITCSDSDQSETSSTIPCSEADKSDTSNTITLPNSHLSSSCSSPVHHPSPGLANSHSLCSVGSDGSFSPIGLRSHSYSSIGAGLVRCSMYQCREQHSHGSHTSLCSSLSLCRSISLRKAKTPPLPPTRTDSLHNFRLSLSEPQPGLIETELDLGEQGLSDPEPGWSEPEPDLSEQGLSEPEPGLSVQGLNDQGRSEPDLSLSEPQLGWSGTLIGSSLQLRSSGSWSTSRSVSHEDPWVQRPQGQSNRVSASGCDSPTPATTSQSPTPATNSQSPAPATTSQSPDSGLRSESQWKVTAVTEVTTVTAAAFNSSSMSLQQPQGIGVLVQPLTASSPGREKLRTSPSSNYSNQSHVLTAGTPMGCHLRARGRAKPRVPERKSSLLCTPLPSNPPPPPLPTLPTPPSLPHSSTCPSTPILVTAPLSVLTPSLPLPLSEMPPPLQLKVLKDPCDADETVSEQRPAPYQSPTPQIIAYTLQMVQLQPVRIAPAVSLHQEAGHQLSLKPEMAGVPLCTTTLNLMMNNHSGSHQDLDAGVSTELSTDAEGWGSPPQLDSESRGTMLLGHSTESLCSECSTGSLDNLQLPELIIQEPELPLHPSSTALDTGQDGDGGGEIDGDEHGSQEIAGDRRTTNSGTDTITSKEEENGGVFEDMLEDLLILTNPRTTEDLFAAIHRNGVCWSKRKVLGRRESEEERVLRYSPSSLTTPTGSLPGMSSLLHLCRCASSCNSFKALLLRKGSRPGNTSRMSAIEMRRCSAPCFQRTQSESSFALPSPPALQLLQFAQLPQVGAVDWEPLSGRKAGSPLHTALFCQQ
ncbi:hypothetical protein AAFF_G00431600 [Aldrovandia affinis]|uniref:Uncharacterized protein n=1 Tax=Aldrovandia affinis TaxID=143900 RepID=A0AAD7WII1_9TELE|nr:hypothetical protein AAFF_G00431600 [Aldrovandia affinis]